MKSEHKNYRVQAGGAAPPPQPLSSSWRQQHGDSENGLAERRGWGNSAGTRTSQKAGGRSMDAFRRVTGSVGREQQVRGDRRRKPAAQVGAAGWRGLSESC